MFTLKDVRDAVLHRIGEDVLDTDPDILSIVNNGINDGYMLIRSTVDQRLKSFKVAFNNPLIIPEAENINTSDVINIIHNKDGRLSVNEYTINGNQIYFLSPLTKGELTIEGIETPKKAIQDTDVINVKDMYIPAIISYGAYTHQLHRRKYSSAQLLLAEFQSYIGQSIEQEG